MGEEEEEKKKTQQVAIFISKLFQIRTSWYIAVCASLAHCGQLRTLLADRCRTTAPSLQGVLLSVTGSLWIITSQQCRRQNKVLKLDRVQSEGMRGTPGITKDTPTETMQFMLDCLLMQTRQKVELVTAYTNTV